MLLEENKALPTFSTSCGLPTTFLAVFAIIFSRVFASDGPFSFVGSDDLFSLGTAFEFELTSAAAFW